MVFTPGSPDPALTKDPLAEVRLESSDDARRWPGSPQARFPWTATTRWRGPGISPTRAPRALAWAGGPARIRP